MKILKTILLIVVALIAIPLVIALFLPKDFKVEKEITIDKPIDEVYEYLRFVKNQDHFGVWQLSDPEMNKTFTGTDGTVGFEYRWEGKKTGKGKQTIIHLNPNRRIETELDFGFGDPAESYFNLDAVGEGQTKVVWGISGDSPYPFNIMSLFYDMGKDFETGLVNLKQVLENK